MEFEGSIIVDILYIYIGFNSFIYWITILLRVKEAYVFVMRVVKYERNCSFYVDYFFYRCCKIFRNEMGCVQKFVYIEL